MKLKPLTKTELDRLRWHWESLRRNQHYRNYYFKLMTDPFPDPDCDAYLNFCQTYHIDYPINPDFTFEHLPQAKAPWIINVFSDGFRWVNDRACFLDVSRLENAGLLRCWICPEFSRNTIEDEFNKILKTWYPKRPNRTNRIENAVETCQQVGNYIGFTISISATRQQIKKQFGKLLARILPAWTGDKMPNKRDRNDWPLSFKIYDQHRPTIGEGEPFESIARTLKIRQDTVYRHYRRAQRAIYGGADCRVEVVKEALPVTCENCQKRRKCLSPCETILCFINQDSTDLIERKDSDMAPEAFHQAAGAYQHKKWMQDEVNDDF